MPKKIMVVSCHSQSLFIFRLDMMKAFISEGYEVVAVGQGAAEEWADKFREHGIGYRQIFVDRNGLNPLKDIKTLKQLKMLFKEENPDKIFCYQAKTVIYSGLAARTLKSAEVYSLIAGLGSGMRTESLKGKFIRFIMATEYRLALKRSRCVIFQNSDDAVEMLRLKAVRPEQCRMMNGSGVNMDKFLHFPLPEKPAFLMVGRLIKDKGVIEYLEASRIIKKSNPEVRCLLVGPFDTNPSALKPEELQGYIDDGTIEYFGEQEDVTPYLREASVFVLLSYHEGRPKSVLEAMACGRAILTTDAPGCRETVTDGFNGYMIPTHNVEAAVEKMQLLIDNPDLVKEMGDRGRAIAEEKYDVKKVNGTVLEIMNIKSLS